MAAKILHDYRKPDTFSVFESTVVGRLHLDRRTYVKF